MPVLVKPLLDTRELSKLLRNVARAPGKVRSAAQNVINRYAALIRREAIALAPVDDGDLETTIRYVLEKLAAEVIAGGMAGKATGKEVDYADVVELGRRDNPNYRPQPYLGPAYERHLPGFVRDLRAAVERALS